MSYFMIPLNVRLLNPLSVAFSERYPYGVMTEKMPFMLCGHSLALEMSSCTRLSMSVNGSNFMLVSSA